MPEDAVDYEVDRRIDRHQEVADDGQLVDEDTKELEHVDDEGEDVTDEEDNNDDEQHDGEAELLALQITEAETSFVGDPHLWRWRG